MIVLDAYGLIALGRNEPAADEVEQLLRSGEVAMSAVNLIEVVDHLLRRAGWSEGKVHASVIQLVIDAITVRSVGTGEAFRAASLRARHYDKAARPLSLADCVLLATVEQGEALATSDPAVASVAVVEGIELVRLPDSSGRRP